MTGMPDRKIILEDGREFAGFSFGAKEERVLEVVFNTSMVGYQEILSDPSYTDQAVVMTYPLIGNYGMAEEDYETALPTVGALVVREYNDSPSNFRCAHTLGEVMARFGIPGISGVDTRALTRSIRDRGSRRALIAPASLSREEGLERIRMTPVPRDAVKRVSRREQRREGNENARLHAVVIDCGMKENILRSLIGRGCRVTVVPYDTAAGEILALSPDGVLVSNGPGDPEDVPETRDTVKALLGVRPLFGICLGHQILSLASGAGTYRLKFGHRGGNHPVKDLESGQIAVTSQNHSYAVDENSLPKAGLTVTHRNLLDGTVEGVKSVLFPAFGVQYHPESAPGPRDSTGLFDRFIRMMEER